MHKRYYYGHKINFVRQFLLSALICTCRVASESTPALDAFFSELDNNHDGAIDASEATQFIGGSIGGQEFDEPQEAADAAASFLHNIDGGDAGLTVSVDELDVHLHSVLSGVRVWEWVRHGLGLPQYSLAFRQHAITPLDFPELVQENGRVLEEELGVTSTFHRSKLVRAVRRQILGLGRPPSDPKLLSCSPVPSGPRGRVAVHWRPPDDPGSPPLHRYVLEVAAQDGQWRTVAELDDQEPAAVVVDLAADAEAAAAAAAGTTITAGAAGAGVAAAVPWGRGVEAGGSAPYRVSAWNLYGRSSYGVAACELPYLPPGAAGLVDTVGVEAARQTAVSARPGYSMVAPLCMAPASAAEAGATAASARVAVADGENITEGCVAGNAAAAAPGTAGGLVAGAAAVPPAASAGCVSAAAGAVSASNQQCAMGLVAAPPADRPWTPFLPTAPSAASAASACAAGVPELPQPPPGYPVVKTQPGPEPQPHPHHQRSHPHPHANPHGVIPHGHPRPHQYPQPQQHQRPYHQQRQQQQDQELLRLLLEHRHGEGPDGPSGPPRFVHDPSSPSSQPRSVPARSERGERSATPHRWWTGLLLAVLPWLLRLLPLPLLRAAVEVVEGLLERAARAVASRRLLLGWLAPSHPGEAEPHAGMTDGTARGAQAAALTASDVGPVGLAPGSAPRWTQSGWLEEPPAPGDAAGVPPLDEVGPAPRERPATPSGIEPLWRPADEGSRRGVRNGARGPADSAAAAGVYIGGKDGRGSRQPPTATARAGGAAGGLLSAALAGHLPPLHRAAGSAGRSGSCGGEVVVGDRGSAGGGDGSSGGGAASAAAAARAAGASGGRPVPHPHRSTSEGDMYGMASSEMEGMDGQAGSSPDTANRHTPMHPRHPFLAQHPPGHPHDPHSHAQPHALLRHHLPGSAPALGVLAAAQPQTRGGSLHGKRGGGLYVGPSPLEADAAEAEQLAAAISAGKVCASPGCRRKLDLLHVRDYLRRHYCGRCQKYVCQAHTAFSPHGEKGSCDHVSACVCVTCFSEFSPDRQRALQKLNKLPQAVAVPGPSAGSVLALAAGSQVVVAGALGGGSPRAPDRRSSAKQMWERAAVKLKAVTRFRGKRGGMDRTSMEPVAE